MAKTALFHAHHSVINAQREHLEANEVHEIDEDDAKKLALMGRGKIVGPDEAKEINAAAKAKPKGGIGGNGKKNEKESE